MKLKGQSYNKGVLHLMNIGMIGAILIGVATFLIIIANKNPFTAYETFFYGVFGNLHGFIEIFVKATPLIFAGLGVAIAFKSGFFNIGAEGQLYMGAIGATATSILLVDLPSPFRLILSIVVAFIFGGLWALIPGILKAKFNISETITTIMFNYIAIQITALVVRGVLQEPGGNLPQSAMIEASGRLPALLPPTRLHGGFLLGVMMVLIVWFVMEKTNIGYELKVVGKNKRTAKHTGIPVMKNIILSAFLSGGLAGLAGMGEVLGVQWRLMEGISGGNGYTAILVALLGFNNPFGVFFSALGFSALQVGSNTMQRQLGIPASIILIILGLMVLLVLAKDRFFKNKTALVQTVGKGEE